MEPHLKLIHQQIQRETTSKKAAEKQLNKLNTEDELSCNASNTVWGVTLRNRYLGLMVQELEEQLAALPRAIGEKIAQRYEIVQRCTGVRFARKKGQTVVSETNLFDPALACHIALLLCMDASCLPKAPKLGNHTSTNGWLVERPTRSQIQDRIAKELHKQLHYRLVQMNFPKWMEKQLDRATDKASGTSAHYVHTRLDDAIRDFRAYLALQQNNEALAGTDLSAWSYPEREIVGSWLLSIVWNTGLFTFEKGTNKRGKPDIFITLSEQGEMLRASYLKSAESYAFDPLPMLVPPADLTFDRLGGWIADGQCINGEITPGFKGKLQMSQRHLNFYNHQQKQAFRINTFILGIIKGLKERNLQLGSWKFYDKDKDRNPTVAERLGINPAYLNELEYSEQVAVLKSDLPAYRKAKRERDQMFDLQEKRVQDGLNSDRLLRIAESCKDDERFYLPDQPDFRSRYYPRTSFLSYQSSDTGRALLEFADGYLIDDHSRSIMAVHVANCAGEDKCDYATRINWTESRHNEMTCVANMLSDDLAWERGWSVLQQYKEEDVLQLAAAMNEFAQLFILKTRKHTYLPCSVDATCSGQQIIAGQLRSAALAELVNVLPTSTPGDIYRRVMDRMIELSIYSELGNFSSKTLKELKGKAGRKLSKLGFISGQYGSGTERQLVDIKAGLDELGLKLRADEWALFTGDKKRKLKSVWEQALEDVTRLRATFNWFRDLADEVAATGASEILLPLPTGSVIHQRYSKREATKVETFHLGSGTYRDQTKTQVLNPTNTPDVGKWRTATCANQIHGLDSSLICLALGDFQHSFFCCHDSCSTYAGAPMIDMKERLRKAYKTVAEFNMWQEVRKANGLPEDATKAPPIVGDLDVELVLKSSYLFS
jgi:DNA-dependent RNA polymerase